MNTVSVAGLDKADVLAALYNAASPQGLGFLHYKHEPMTREQAQELLQSTRNFDYLYGRVMKIYFDDDDMDNLYVRLYDRDNGIGAAEMVITALRSSKGIL